MNPCRRSVPGYLLRAAVLVGMEKVYHKVNKKKPKGKLCEQKKCRSPPVGQLCVPGGRAQKNRLGGRFSNVGADNSGSYSVLCHFPAQASQPHRFGDGLGPGQVIVQHAARHAYGISSLLLAKVVAVHPYV